MLTRSGRSWPALAMAAALAAFIAGVLVLDRYADRGDQLLLGLATLAVLLAAALAFEPEVRFQAGLVVVVATCAEVVGSLVWGLYTYRLENLPAFVPPGHGVVYLCGFALARGLRGHERTLLGVALCGVVGWGLAGITVLPRPDLSGALGCTVLALVLARSRNAVYAGVALAVGALELYGTALGTWTWAAAVPGLGLPQGNPPSGVASGYVLFDVCALAITALVLRGRFAAALAGASARS